MALHLLTHAQAFFAVSHLKVQFAVFGAAVVHGAAPLTNDGGAHHCPTELTIVLGHHGNSGQSGRHVNKAELVRV